MGADRFSRLHPLVNLIYFALVAGFTMFNMHPVCLVISLFSGTAYSIYLNGRKAVKFSLLFMLPVILATALVNPAFNHEGVTILFYNFNGNPITLESIVYGIFAACMLAAVIQWFACWNRVMTSDRIIFLFGRIVPSLSLLLTMSLGFVPRFKDKYSEIRDARRCMGAGSGPKGRFSRIKEGVNILSVMLSWTMDDAVHLSQSMKQRGYSLRDRRRTAYGIYRFKGRDAVFLTVTVILSAFVLYGILSGVLKWQYFPYIYGGAGGSAEYLFYAAYAGLNLLPLITGIHEERTFKNMKEFNYGTD